MLGLERQLGQQRACLIKREGLSLSPNTHVQKPVTAEQHIPASLVLRRQTGEFLVAAGQPIWLNW